MGQQAAKQSGFIVLMGMLMLVVGAAVWFGSAASLKSNQMKIQKDDKYKAQLHEVKQRMLQYAVLHPEIYSDATAEPGPGYFPCPDEDGDGIAEGSCGSPGTDDQLFVYGMVPYKISSRNLTFLDSDINNRLFWYAVDARFVNNSEVFTSTQNNRFAELNVDLDTEVSPATGPNTAPLFLDGEDEIVMVLFYAGDPLPGQSRPSSNYGDYLEQPLIVDGAPSDFMTAGTSPGALNDYVISITRKEWEAAVLSRVTQDIDEDGEADLCTSVAANASHWFNACVYNSPGNPPNFSCTYDALASDNLSGQGWRDLVCP